MVWLWVAIRRLKSSSVGAFLDLVAKMESVSLCARSAPTPPSLRSCPNIRPALKQPADDGSTVSQWLSQSHRWSRLGFGKDYNWYKDWIFGFGKDWVKVLRGVLPATVAAGVLPATEFLRRFGRLMRGALRRVSTDKILRFNTTLIIIKLCL